MQQDKPTLRNYYFPNSIAFEKSLVRFKELSNESEVEARVIDTCGVYFFSAQQPLASLAFSKRLFEELSISRAIELWRAMDLYHAIVEHIAAHPQRDEIELIYSTLEPFSPMQHFVVSYTVPMTRYVSIGIIAQNQTDAIELAHERMLSLTLWDDTPLCPLLEDYVEEDTAERIEQEKRDRATRPYPMSFEAKEVAAWPAFVINDTQQRIIQD